MSAESDAARRVSELEAELAGARARIAMLEGVVDSLRDSRGDFMATMNHELRTPLNHIIGFSDVLLLGMAGELNAEQRTQLQMILRSGRYLLSIVNDVQDLMRLDGGVIDIADNVFAAEEAVDAALEMSRIGGTEKGIELVSQVVPNTVWVRSDRKRVRQVLVNLINNAVKFTHAGRITVRAVRDGEGVRFSVEDTGYGMTPGALAAVFDDFTQLPPHSPDLAKSQGVGLGLAISRRLVALLGGTLGATSTPGEGSTFHFLVPADDTTAPGR